MQAEQETGMQLLASVEAQEIPKVGVEPMPVHFLEEFSSNQDMDTLQGLLHPICNSPSRRHT